MARPGRVLLPLGVGFPPFPSWTRREGRGEREEGKGGTAHLPSTIQTRGGGGARPALAGPPLLIHGPLRPINPREGSGNPRCSVKSRFHPEPFRCPNIGFQYINIYVSTISRLLVMSVITSRTPNNLWYIKTCKLIIKLSS